MQVGRNEEVARTFQGTDSLPVMFVTSEETILVNKKVQGKRNSIYPFDENSLS